MWYLATFVQQEKENPKKHRSITSIATIIDFSTEGIDRHVYGRPSHEILTNTHTYTKLLDPEQVLQEQHNNPQIVVGNLNLQHMHWFRLL